MAGTCVGLGLVVVDGAVQLDGPTQLAWPNETNCPVAENNGLHVDPGTGAVWVAPPVAPYYQEFTGANRVIVPGDTDDVVLGPYQLEHHIGDCGQRLVVARVAGGFAGFRMASGNFWTIHGYASLFVDDAPLLTTGDRIVAAHENNSGGIGGDAHAFEDVPFAVTLDPGQTLKVVCNYTLSIAQLTTNVANSLTYRPPHITALFLPVPT